jgi:predicted DNA-binding protein
MAENAKKVSVNLPYEAVLALEELAKVRGTTMTEVLRRAIFTEKYLSDQVAEGGKILVEEKNKKLKQLVFAR